MDQDSPTNPITDQDAELAIREFRELKRLWEDSLRFEAQRRLGNKLFPVGSTRDRALQWAVSKVRELRRGQLSVEKQAKGDVERLERIGSMLEESRYAMLLRRQYLRSFQAMEATTRRPGPNSVPYSPPHDEFQPDVKTLAFYLPQFHPIPENDQWWGPGFTEWMNVSKSVPVFEGHYQPHLPADLGFYDLRVPQVLEQQAQIAQAYGIHGFAFYYYWFEGKQLLDMPLREFAQSKRISLPFCIVWANENWTRTWDGQDREVLIHQTHSPASDLSFIRDIEPFLRNERYVRVFGRPMIIIFRPALLPNAKESAERWREYCDKAGLGDPYLVSAQSHDERDPADFGFDAAVSFAPNMDHHKELRVYGEEGPALRRYDPRVETAVFSYPGLAARKITSDPPKAYPLFETVCPMWDNSARRPGKGVAFAYSNPTLYGRWLAKARRRTLRNDKLPEPFLFVNAWNEWAEGAHLEPDQRYGFAYLKATRDALEGVFDRDLAWETVLSRPSSAMCEDSILVFDLGEPDTSPTYQRVRQGVRPDRFLGMGHRLGTEEPGASPGLGSGLPVRVVCVLHEPMGLALSSFIRSAAHFIPNLRHRLEVGDVTSAELHEVFTHLGEHRCAERGLEQLRDMGIDLLDCDFNRAYKYHRASCGRHDVLMIKNECRPEETAQVLLDLTGKEVAVETAEPAAIDRDLLSLLMDDVYRLKPVIDRIQSTQYASHFYLAEELHRWHRFLLGETI